MLRKFGNNNLIKLLLIYLTRDNFSIKIKIELTKDPKEKKELERELINKYDRRNEYTLEDKELSIENIKSYDFIVSGSGAIAKTIIFALKKKGVKNIFIQGRNKKKIKDLINKFKCSEYRANSNLKNNQLFLINCTPIGMMGKNVEKIPFTNKLIKKSSIVMDLVNHPVNTKFVKSANKYKK